MNGLLKLLIVEDCTNLSIAVACPVRSHYLHSRMTNILPNKIQGEESIEKQRQFLLSAASFFNVRKVCLSPCSCRVCFVPTFCYKLVLFEHHLLHCPFQNISSEQVPAMTLTSLQTNSNYSLAKSGLLVRNTLKINTPQYFLG